MKSKNIPIIGICLLILSITPVNAFEIERSNYNCGNNYEMGTYTTVESLNVNSDYIQCMGIEKYNNIATLQYTSVPENKTITNSNINQKLEYVDKYTKDSTLMAIIGLLSMFIIMYGLGEYGQYLRPPVGAPPTTQLKSVGILCLGIAGVTYPLLSILIDGLVLRYRLKKE